MAQKLMHYWAFMYFLGNIFAQFLLFAPIAATYFNVMVAIGVILLVANMDKLHFSGMLKAHNFIYIYTLLMIVYQFTFGWSNINDRTWPYLAAKVVSDFMFVISVSSFPSFYEKKFYLYMAIMTAVLIVIGRFTGEINTVTGRQTFGFGNENSLSAIAAVSAACMFIQVPKLKKWHWGVLGICLYGLFMGGSRTATAALLIGLIFKYGLKPKTVSVIIAVSISLMIVDYFNIKLPGISRVMESVENADFDSGRDAERKASLLMIRENPLTGNGLYAQQSEEAMKISELGSHNGYIDIIKFMGFGFGSVILISLFLYLKKIYSYFNKSPNLNLRSHLYAVFMVCAMAMYEAYIWGVNQMITTCMFISMSLLGSMMRTKSDRISVDTAKDPKNKK